MYEGKGTGFETGNRLGVRPVVRQSKLYRTNESGNAMKSLFGQDHLAWKTDAQEGVFAGQGVYDALTASTSSPQQQQAEAPTGGTAPWQQEQEQCQEIEYPNPGCVASCDACGAVVDRFYHCLDCQESVGGLFDLCTTCCASVYLKGTSAAPQHPTHLYASHRMAHITPP